MPSSTRKAQRRTDALSRERIVEAAIALLDAAGEGGLTFRVLTEQLATGPGAIYWHVANKGELLEAATDAVVASALATEPAGSPQEAIRAVALSLFDVIDEHPWLATQLAVQLSRAPGKSVTPRLLESFGRQVSKLGGPEADWFTVASALMYYVLGAAGQNSVNGATATPTTSRAEFLDAVSTAWERLDPEDYPFTRAVAEQARHHDDRAQFLAGVDLMLSGITLTWTGARP
jgi:AcrR family transcriptional regulator